MINANPRKTHTQLELICNQIACEIRDINDGAIPNDRLEVLLNDFAQEVLRRSK